jgi:hypothetical protein
VTRTWFDEEPPISGGLWQARDLLRVGLERPILFVLAGALYAAALAGCFLWTRHTYAPEYVLRVVEADGDRTGVSGPRLQLAEYVREAVFTSKPLLRVMGRNGLYASLANSNPRAALDSFREDIDVEVRQNYFVDARPVGAAPRSALLLVRYRNADPDVATTVTRELGELVVNREHETLREGTARAADLAKTQVDDARRALALRRSAAASMRADLDESGASVPRRRLALIGLLESLPALELAQDQREKREASLAFGAAIERRGVGTVFQVVDDASLPGDAGARGTREFLGAAAFVLGLPLLAIAVGAFAPRRASV